MAIKGEVHVKSMIWAPKISLNDGRYVIRPFECKIIGQAEGLARVKASIHTFFTTFDDEEWRIQWRPMKAAWFCALLFDPRFGGQNCLSCGGSLERGWKLQVQRRSNLSRERLPPAAR